MATWMKETDQAIYLMQGAYYIDKIEKRPYGPEQTRLTLLDMKDWFTRPDPPGGMVVAWDTGDPEPQPQPRPEATIELTQVPQVVEVKELFQIQGKIAPTYVGKAVQLFIGGQLATSAPKVNPNGTWTINYRFFGTGTRSLKVTIDDQSLDFGIKVVESPPAQVDLRLSGSVGIGGLNHGEDVISVKERLKALGFDFFQVSPTVDAGLIQAIKLFQSVIAGSVKLIGDGRVDVGGQTQTFLEAMNAPKWMLMPIRGEGFVNFERADLADQHDYGVSWMADSIINAGKYYETNYRKGRSNISLIPVNDVSFPKGGDTPDHSGHEAGNACDISIPREGGSYGTTWQSSNYDQGATRAILQAIKAQPLARKIFFNDPKLIGEGLCQRAGGHDNHIHFEVGVPNPA
ncbi:MAG: hypothetical protein AAF728_13955 [Cyanobacteria bacterium P01_D01_bin.128]